MYKNYFLAISFCLLLQSGFALAQTVPDTAQTGEASAPTNAGSEASAPTTATPTPAAPAGMHASLVANRAGGYGVATKAVVAGLVVGGLAAVVLEAATDGSKIDDLPTGTNTTTTTTTSSSSN